MRVFLDANILFAAARQQSHTRLLLEVMLAYHVECLTNAYAVEEARRNLRRVHPGSLPELDALLPRLEMVNRLVSKIEITLKPKDIPILYGAIAGKATHLLTYDEEDFGELMRKPYKSVRVLTPKQMIQELKRHGILQPGAT